MRIIAALLVLAFTWQAQTSRLPSTSTADAPMARRSPDIAFSPRLDPGAFETAAVADINSDGRLDIVSGDSWYEAPSWGRHTFREVAFSGNYFDSFSVLPVDVDADGFIDIADVSWFARRTAISTSCVRARAGCSCSKT